MHISVTFFYNSPVADIPEYLPEYLAKISARISSPECLAQNIQQNMLHFYSLSIWSLVLHTLL
jgi:hypothetical protein